MSGLSVNVKKEYQPCVVCCADSNEYYSQTDYLRDEYGNIISPIENEIPIHQECLNQEIENEKNFNSSYLMLGFICLAMIMLVLILSTL